MGNIFARICQAIEEERVAVSWHANRQCRKRGIRPWQLIATVEYAKLLSERPRTKPNPSVVVRQILADGTDVEAVWAWVRRGDWAKLVTVYFPETQ